ncbi:MAG: response regulator transcription factor [Roseivirga sp.]|nr:response regulator transcription factor [Roseivirga sp.]
MDDHMFKILIADDEPLARDSISILIEKVSNCKVVATAGNGKDAFERILIEEPDIVFMDIQMPYLTGTEVVEKVNATGPPFFIFVTAFEDQAIKAFELNAVDYLLKPFSDERFYRSLNKVKNYIKTHAVARDLTMTPKAAFPKKYKEQFTIKSSGKIQFVRTEEIIYFKSSGNYVELHTRSAKHLLRMKIGELEEQVDPSLFTRIHRSAIVRNIEIKELQTYFNGEYIAILRSGVELKVSRSYRLNLDSIIQ